MPEHLIRLRGAWDWRDGTRARRLDLPTAWPAGLAGPLVLSRGFRRPPNTAEGEAVALRLEDVPGLRSARLNGIEIALPTAGAGAGPIEVPLGGRLLPRNLLTLEVDPAGVGDLPWGAIALVIRGA